VFPAKRQTVMADEESSEAILNATTQPDTAAATDKLLVDVGALAIKVTALAPISVDEMIFCPRVIHQKAE